MVLIEDGKGKGNFAQVDSSGKLQTDAVTQTAEHASNHEQGKAYQWVFEQTPTAANDCFLYMKNSDDDDLVIEGVTLRVPTNEQIQFKIGDSGTTSGGTSAIPVNLNTLSGREAEGTFEAGNDITGISGGSTFDKLWVGASDTSAHFNFEQDVILGKNGVFTMYATTGAIQINGTLVFNYHVEA
jgi:hypothetical protein